ncbi:MAG: hypothetical protein N3B16_09765 [Candidatus Aminicenantes bacterium]|nr:hypothetical protein [Candidatus Aminicenantes bacterium]
MNELINSLFIFLKTHEVWLRWLSLASLITFLATPIIVIAIIIKLPANYFSQPGGQRSRFFLRYPVAYPIFLIVKNLIGFFLIFIGFILLFLPGQGFLTILIGLLLINFPGKSRLERALLSRPGVQNKINKLRQRFHQPPLAL